jgi:hypothetical protein
MKNRRIHAEHLVGRTVHDINDEKVGRIEEIEVETTGRSCYVNGFVLGEAGLLRRLSIRGIGPLFFRSLAAKGRTSSRTVPWEKLDISNPRKPKLRCRKSEL